MILSQSSASAYDRLKKIWKYIKTRKNSIVKFLDYRIPVSVDIRNSMDPMGTTDITDTEQ